jgi:hypothetical protein
MDSAGYGTDESKARFVAIRDALRTGLDGVAVVGDIGTWVVGVANGMIFEIHDDAQDTSFYMLGGYSTSSTAPTLATFIGSTGANLRTRFKAMQVAFASASVSPLAGLVVGVNTDTTIARADLDYDTPATLTYSGGDFTTLTTINPDSLGGIQAILPAHCPYGMTNDTGASTTAVSHALGYDDTLGVWAYMATQLNHDRIAWCTWGKNIIDPLTGSDGVGMAYVWGQDSDRGYASTYKEVNARDAGGTWRDYDLAPTNGLDAGNHKITGGGDDGKLNWRPVSVENGTGGSGQKGFMKPGILVEIGLFGAREFFRKPIQFPNVANPVICYFNAMAIWWEDGARMFPSYV